MSGNLSDSAAPANNNLLRSKQVSPLPIGPGGNNPIKRQMNETNIQLSMMQAQAAANTKYDPPVPRPVSKQVIIEKFIDNNSILPQTLMVIGGLCIVYGLVTK
jgi:hypothetical protein